MRTIKRQWMYVLILSAILSIVINSTVLSSLINNYFVENSKINYEHHYEQIIDFTRKALAENYTRHQLETQLDTHLIDPILEIRLYDANGNLMADVIGMPFGMNGMMSNHMMNRMMGIPSEKIDSTEITDAGVLLGRLEVIRYSSIGNSLQTRMFVFALIKNSIFSFGIALVLMFIIGSMISRKMSRDLKNTAELATNIDLGNETNIQQSKVREIQIIQQSLEALQAKLKLKQSSRKRLLDELVHQTRTPLTILKTHLEGFEDGILEMNTDEIKTCEAQIESITAIIANMSAMIDAEKNLDAVELEDIEISQLLKQIVGALRVQFSKKQIDLIFHGHGKIIIKSDKNKLSQSIYNILTNAYKFTKPNGRVSVSYEMNGDDLKIIIEDTGSGIEQEQISHLFDAYYRGSNAVGIPGEGLGLYVVKENLNRIHGQLQVESELGKGSRFMIKIPRHMQEPS